MTSVMPKPPAAFSPFSATRSSFHQAGQPFGHGVAPAAADDVADEKNAHAITPYDNQ